MWKDKKKVRKVKEKHTKIGKMIYAFALWCVSVG